MIAATVVALMGCGVRRTQAGLWGVRLSAWFLLLLIYVGVMLLRRAVGHA